MDKQPTRGNIILTFRKLIFRAVQIVPHCRALDAALATVATPRRPDGTAEKRDAAKCHSRYRYDGFRGYDNGYVKGFAAGLGGPGERIFCLKFKMSEGGTWISYLGFSRFGSSSHVVAFPPL